jgi:hypothetical protein
MPFPISVTVGDGSAAAVAVSSAAIALVFLLRPIIKKVSKPEDLRFYAICSLLGVLALLVAGAVCTGLIARQDADQQPTPARLAQLSPRECEELKANTRARAVADRQQKEGQQACARPVHGSPKSEYISN